MISSFLTRNECVILIDGIKANYNTKLVEVKDDVFQIYLTKKEFLGNVKTLSTENGVEYYDNLVSPILQFNLGGFYPYDNTLLQRARFYYIKGFYAKSNFVNKSEQFIEWAESIIESFKKDFLTRYPKEKSFLYSETAIDWINKNNANLINGGQQWKI